MSLDLSTVSRGPARDSLERLMTLDRALVERFPDAFPSTLLARAIEDPVLAPWVAGWIAALEKAGTPYLRPLRGLASHGLLAELLVTEEWPVTPDRVVSLDVSFDADHTVVVHELVPEPGERKVVRWAWPSEPPTIAYQKACDLRVRPGGYGSPPLLVYPDGRRTPLPTPEEDAGGGGLVLDDRTVIVYGHLEDYLGGFIWVLDLPTGRVQKRHSTTRAVWELAATPDLRRIVAATSAGIELWDQGSHIPLTLDHSSGMRLSVSPSGKFLATLAGRRLRVHDLDALRGKQPPQGFPAQFSPDGARLIVGHRLFDGRTGALVATIDPMIRGGYLSGKPPSPWFHLGTERLVQMYHRVPMRWAARDGAPLGDTPGWSARLIGPHVAYDATGTRLAVHDLAGLSIWDLDEGSRISICEEVELCDRVALSADAQWVALGAEDHLRIVRADTGEVVWRHDDPPTETPSHSWPGGPERLFFTPAGNVVRYRKGDGWRMWSVAGKPLQHTETWNPARPPGWSIAHDQELTRFVYRDTCIVLPSAGAWETNPTDPSIVANDEVHLQLRAGGDRSLAR